MSGGTERHLPPSPARPEHFSALCFGTGSAAFRASRWWGGAPVWGGGGGRVNAQKEEGVTIGKRGCMARRDVDCRSYFPREIFHRE